MLRLFFTFLLSFLFFIPFLTIVSSIELNAAPNTILPLKRPLDFHRYDYSLESINDMVLKEGGKVIGEINEQKLKKSENLYLFLKRVGFQNKDVELIILTIQSNYPNEKILRKLPIKHQIYYSIPKDNLGLAINFKIGKDRDLYLWENHFGNLETKITKRPFIKNTFIKKIEIKDNLYNAAMKERLPQNIFSELTKILSFSIDFQRELRRGDIFETLYSQKIDLISNTIIETDPILYINAKLRNTNLKFYRYITKDGYSGYFDEKGKSSKKTLMKTPLNGARLSSGYGSRKHPILGFTKMHRGVDFAAPKGTPIFAAGDGVIEFSGWKGAFGKYIRIRHNSTFKTVYAHLSKIYKRRGSRVKQGETIGALGSTGRSTGPHLHYEILFNGKQVNPLRIKLPSGKNVPSNELKKFFNKQAIIDKTIIAMKNGNLTKKLAYLKKHNKNFK